MARRELSHRRILITGASRGVGQELALAFARKKTHLVLVARGAEALQSQEPELLEAGAASVHVQPGDVTLSERRTSLVEWVQQRWGALDILVNNAGVSAHGRFIEHNEATLRKIMELNFFAVTELTRQTLPLLAAAQDAVIVNVGSILGYRGTPHNSEYCASKFALRGWSEALRAELATAGVDVLLVSPGTIDSDFVDHLVVKTGSLPWPKQKGIAPNEAARQIIRAIERRKTEIYPNWRGRLLVTANRWLPSLVDRVMRRYGG